MGPRQAPGKHRGSQQVPMGCWWVFGSVTLLLGAFGNLPLSLRAELRVLH